ncbi:MAG: hypothetical protein J6Z11_07860, partial [Candidatus Riflebacteria bacterium]|nr:hypothetical protein [Candidatus Riflebacteria bacterium]
PNGPFGISSYLDSEVNLKSGIASISLKVNHKGIGDCLPISVYASEVNVGVDDGVFDLNLFYKGNIEKRINEPLNDLAKLLNEELQGEISVNNAKVRWNGLYFDGSLKASKIATESWDYSVIGKLASGSIDIKGKWLGTQDQMSKFESDFNISNLKLTKDNLARFGLNDFNYKAGTIGIKGQIKGDIASFSASGNAFIDNWSFFDKKLKKADINWNLSEDLTLNTNSFINTSLGHINAS